MYIFYRAFLIGMDCVCSMLLFIPAILMVQKLMGRKIISVHTVFLLLYAGALAGIFSVTGLPNIKYFEVDFTLNYIPMVDILNSPVQYFLNILMFVPIGFLLPLLWEKCGDWKHVLGFGAFLTVFIEVAQVFTFRTTDIDDLLTNLCGAALGFLLVSLMSKKFKVPLPAGRGAEHAGELWIIFAVTFSINFFVQPYWSAFLWDSLLL